MTEKLLRTRAPFEPSSKQPVTRGSFQIDDMVRLQSLRAHPLLSLIRDHTRPKLPPRLPVRYACSIGPSVISKARIRSFVTGRLVRPAVDPRYPALSAPDTSTISPTISSLDLLPRISTHPSLANVQIRCGPRNTFNPSHIVRKRRHGFLARLRTRKGRAILKRRKCKGRTTLSH